MASYSKRVLRKNCEVFLIGTYSPQIVGNKLPSKREVLKVLFFNLREVKLKLQDAARLAIRETLLFWEKARIPTQSEKNCIPKLKTLYEEWRDLQKYASKTQEKKSTRQVEKENKFVGKLDDILDIAAQNALTVMTNQEDIQFLKKQREKGRPGYMYGIDKQLAEQEAKSHERAEKAKNYKKRKIEELDELSEKVELESTSDSEEDVRDINTGLDVQPTLSVDEAVLQKKSRGRQQIVTERLVSALDKCKVSDREAIHIISAVADALGHDLNDLVLNRASLQRSRRELRKKRAEKIKNEFKGLDLNAAVLHWDGKLLPALTSHETVDRLPIIISNGAIEQILHVPALESGTGEGQAEAIFHVLCDWGLQETVKACCFDTTATNTGKQNGACVLLERLLERKLLYLPCRHHILEIILRAVFERKIPGTSGPNVPLFKRFQDAWPEIDKSKFLPGIEDSEVRQIFEDKSRLIEYLKNLTDFSRNDYKEFAELCIIFLGERTKKNVHFHYPGAMHHARWMAKAIYSLKMYLFRNEFKMNASTKTALRDVCIFIVKLYAKHWFLAPLPTKAPQSDLNLLKNLYKYRNIDEAVSEIALTKFLNHLWYLSPEAVAFSIFDDDVSFEIKDNMRKKILEKPECLDNIDDEFEEVPTVPNKITYKRSELGEIGELDQFCSSDTKIFFTRFCIDLSFLEKNPSEWDTDDGYKRGKNIVEKIKVTNDTAERGIKLVEDYNNKLSSSDEQKQFIFKVVSHYRKKFPDCKKSTLVVELEDCNR